MNGEVWSEKEIEHLKMVYPTSGYLGHISVFPKRNSSMCYHMASRLKLKSFKIKWKPIWNKGVHQWENRIHPMLGKKHTDKTKQIIRLKSVDRFFSDETRLKLSNSRRGSRNPNWRGGITERRYPDVFTIKLKENVRNKYYRCCVLCLKDESINGRKLSIHHIDFNKGNCIPKNLVPICNKCHGLVSHDRIYSEQYLTILKEGEEGYHVWKQSTIQG